jgi:hypothetical protein
MLLILGVVTVFAVGCIHTDKTEIRDEARMAVEFENEIAGRMFYETLSRRPNSGQQEESTSRVSLPVVFSNEHKVVRGPNIAFNRAVRECDTNHDGRITELEARIWSGR